MGDASAAIALGARLVLAATLTFAAVAKLATRHRLVDTVASLVPARLARPAAAVLPVVELALAATLVVARGPAPGLVAAALLVVFTAVLVRAHARRVPCPCFGAGPDGHAPGPRAVVRNGVLVALAVLATGDVDGVGAGGVAFAIVVLGVPAFVTMVAASRRA